MTAVITMMRMRMKMKMKTAMPMIIIILTVTTLRPSMMVTFHAQLFLSYLNYFTDIQQSLVSAGAIKNKVDEHLANLKSLLMAGIHG